MSFDQDNSIQLDKGRADAVAFTDGRYCKRVEVSPTEIYFCYRKFEDGSTTDATLTDGKWQIVKSDGAGGFTYPASPGVNGGWDPGYNFNADAPASLTYFEL